VFPTTTSPDRCEALCTDPARSSLVDGEGERARNAARGRRVAEQTRTLAVRGDARCEVTRGAR
jgi:hypothetical protein